MLGALPYRRQTPPARAHPPTNSHRLTDSHAHSQTHRLIHTDSQTHTHTHRLTDSLTHTRTHGSGWWQLLLFASVYTEGLAKNCIGQAWYLDDDVLIFVVLLLLLTVYSHSKRASFACGLVLLCAHLGYTLYFSYLKDIRIYEFFDTLTNSDFDFFDDFYVLPWFRAGPSFLGFFFGVLYRNYFDEKSQMKLASKQRDPPRSTDSPSVQQEQLPTASERTPSAENREKQPKTLLGRLEQLSAGNRAVVPLLYLIGLGTIFLIVWLPDCILYHDRDYWNAWVQYLWNTLSRPLYCAGLAVITIPNMIGSRDIIVDVLGSKPFIFLSRLTYTAYLLQQNVIIIMVVNSGQSFEYSYDNIAQLFTLVLLITLTGACIMVLFVELPFMNLDSLIFEGRAQPDRARAKEAKPPEVSHNAGQAPLREEHPVSLATNDPHLQIQIDNDNKSTEISNRGPESAAKQEQPR